MARSKEPKIVERVDDSDDEEIEEDEAFNSEDELMYGDLFTKSKKSKGGKKGGKRDGKLIGEDSDSGEDSEESADGDDGSNDSGSENDWAGSSSDSEGEDDDGGEYMLNLLSNLDKQVTPSKSSGKSGKKSESKGEGGKISLDNVASEAAVRLPESEYQTGALSAMSKANDGKLTLDSLMGGIADTANFASVQKSMHALSSGGQTNSSKSGTVTQKKLETTAIPVSRVISDRASRKVHTAATTTEVTRWMDAVHEQRDAETLDFRTNKGGATTNRVTRDTLVEKFEATNDFEKELQNALEVAGMEDEKKMRRMEKKRLIGEEDGDDNDDDKIMGEGDDDLGSNRITMEEYKKRHGELAKLRALMFYEEQKRHRINKIKSKKYRKIRKRRQDRLDNAEEDAAILDGDATADRERVEQEEMERMEERMTLAHKNTSKWARRMLRRGSKMDVEERRALSLQIAKGEELRRKVLGEEGDGESGSEDETEEGLLKKARDILMEDDDEDEDTDGGKKKKKGLLSMEFMKRGMEAQRTRAKEEARKLLEELEANEIDVSSDSEDEDDFDKSEKNSKTKKPKVATEAETNKVLPEGKLVASSLQFGKADGFAIKVDGNIELSGNGGQIIEKAKESDEMDDEQEATQGKKKRRKKKKHEVKDDGEVVDPSSTSKKANNTTTSSTMEEEEENPWIVSKSNTKKYSKPLSTTVNINEAASMLVDNPVQDDKSGKRKQRDDDDSAIVKSKEEKESEEANSNETTTTPTPVAAEKEVGVADLSQAELVRRAFAAPADLVAAEEEFQKEKEQMKERDDPTRKQKEDKIVTGWGSWAGAGAPPPRKKQRKLPPKLRAPTSKKSDNVPKRKDDGISTVIINERRLKKTSKFQLSEIPYPYRSREEYEKAIAGNIGQEWNTLQGTKEMSRPAVLVRAGKIIQPIATKVKTKVKKQRRAPAKF